MQAILSKPEVNGSIIGRTVSYEYNGFVFVGRAVSRTERGIITIVLGENPNVVAPFRGEVYAPECDVEVLP